MLVKKFKLRVPGQKKYFIVLVYDTVKSLRLGIDKFHRKTGEDEYSEGTFGVCHSYRKVKTYEDGREEEIDEIGTIRLAEKHLSSSVVSHELVHAAIHQYTLGKENRNMNLEDMANEDVFAHIYSDLFRKMTLAMYRHKLWGEI